MSHPEGFKIAQKLIAEEVEQKTGVLDLRSLGLKDFPEGIFAPEMSHLKELWVGSGVFYVGETWRNLKYDFGSNDIKRLMCMIPRLTRLKSLRMEGRHQRDGFLEVGDLDGLSELPCLEHLFLGHTSIQNLSSLSGLLSLQTLECAGTSVNDLSPLSSLRDLQTLGCNGTAVSDLSPLSHLDSLQSLTCAGTAVSDLSPLSHLDSLQSLTCASTLVSDLSSLSHLASLQRLTCRNTPVSDLSPLSDLESLQHLDCADTAISDLSSLSRLGSLESLDCDDTSVSDLSPLSNLSRLESISCDGSSVSDLSPLSGLQQLTSLFCSNTSVSDLSSLSGLRSLVGLFCEGTSVSDLSPLSNLESLRILDFSRGPVSDLSPLFNLQSLRELYCNATSVSDLSPLSGLQDLKELFCGDTSVSDLSPLSGLQKLEELYCESTSVSDLSPLSDLKNLKDLWCDGSPVKDLNALARMGNLKRLHCSNTSVSDLNPLSEVQSLRSLDCASTLVRDLSPLSSSLNLWRLELGGCHLDDFPKALLDSKRPKYLNLGDGATVRGVPSDVLGEGCFEGLRAHFADNGGGTEALPDVKVLVLGNGRIGKTQICNRLMGQEYEAVATSTHGILINSANLSTPNQEVDHALLNLWDFGGQDLYYGTHTLFARTRALFLIVWAAEAENAEEHETHGICWRNRPLSWWLNYVENLGGKNSAVILIQNQCDYASQEWVAPPCEDAALEPFAFVRKIHYSAQEDRGRGTLDDTLREAVRELRRNEGIGSIGVGRAKVRARLLAWRDSDAQVSDPSERKHRFLSQADFETLCKEAGGISSSQHFLTYLHNSGVVFYREGIFKDRILLDQTWALDAIYSVFDRDKSYSVLRKMGGRFDRPTLEALIWKDDGHGNAYSEDEQRLFLSLMEECGICFVHKLGKGQRDQRDDTTEYIAPDLLPDRSEVEGQLEGRWNLAESITERAVLFPFLPPGVLRQIVSEFGGEAGDTAVYWKDGLFFYDQRSRAGAVIEQRPDADGCSGRIVLEAQGGGASKLLEMIWERIDDLIKGAGFRDLVIEGEPLRPEREKSKRPCKSELLSEPELVDRPEAKKIEFSGGPTPVDQFEVCVSYAWEPERSEDPKRRELVESLCQRMSGAGIEVVRDVSHSSLGASISKFEKRIGRADRIFIFLSEAYLKSAHCMHELLMIWQQCQLQEEVFRQRVRPFTLPETKIFKPADRIKHAIYWKEQFKEFDDLIRKHGADVVGETDLRNWKNMAKFRQEVSEMLAQMADSLQARDFDEYVEAAVQECIQDREKPDVS